MNIQHLIYVLEVNNCGSISKAAQNLFMAQPNLSNAIKDLEREIGIVIFNRTSKGVETTPEGLEFLRHANEIVSRFNALEHFYRKQKPNIIRLSITTMRSSNICTKLIHYLNNINTKERSFRIQFKEATNFDAINDVVSDQADIGVIRSNSTNFNYFYQLAKSKQCALVPLPAESYSVLMSANHPLAKVEFLNPNMLKPYIEVIHGDFETPMYPYSEVYTSELAEEHSIKLVLVYDRGTLLDMVRNVWGAYTWTTSTHPNTLKINNVVEKKCENYNIDGREAIIYKKTTPLNQDMLCVIDYLTKPMAAK